MVEIVIDQHLRKKAIAEIKQNILRQNGLEGSMEAGFVAEEMADGALDMSVQSALIKLRVYASPPDHKVLSMYRGPQLTNMKELRDFTTLSLTLLGLTEETAEELMDKYIFTE
ncbi:hypothetical protein K2Q00_01430 [Patescibacteria group bacterium]|nr:hypothetical protein [Patescibacteria group bacterium]